MTVDHSVGVLRITTIGERDRQQHIDRLDFLVGSAVGKVLVGVDTCLPLGAGDNLSVLRSGTVHKSSTEHK